MPSLRPLTWATFAPAVLVAIALPIGFIEREVAVVAAVYGLYFVLPAVIAWVLDGLRTRMPTSLRVTVGLLIVVLGAPYIVLLLWMGPLLLPGLVQISVVVIVAVRFLRSGSFASRFARPS